jgi:hypothetical protein
MPWRLDDGGIRGGPYTVRRGLNPGEGLSDGVSDQDAKSAMPAESKPEQDLTRQGKKIRPVAGR